MLIKLNTKLLIQVFILLLVIFLPSCALRDIYSQYRLRQWNEREAKDFEASDFIGTFIRSQKDYYHERGKFANNLDDLGLVLPSLKYHDMQIIETDETKAVMIAKPKKNNLHSLVGMILYDEEEEKYRFIICRTLKPQKSIELPTQPFVGWSLFCAKESGPIIFSKTE